MPKSYKKCKKQKEVKLKPIQKKNSTVGEVKKTKEIKLRPTIMGKFEP